eukprot:3915339-Prorocentrum_lima.AAC.1
MTSSLVGSEMCIRDRNCAVGAQGRPEALNTMQAGWHKFMGNLLLLTYVAVSYTHLTLPTICSV